MSKETVATILTFLAAVATLAANTLPVSDTGKAILTFAVLVINAALSAFFGAVTVKARQARTPHCAHAVGASVEAAKLAGRQAVRKPTNTR